MDGVEKMSTDLVKVCLHVGIYDSGCALSFYGNPDDIRQLTFRIRPNQGSPMQLTAVLLNSNKEFIKFGYEASETYMDLADVEKDDYYYFKNLKSLLRETSSPTTTLEDISGKTVDAIDVVSQVFRFLKKEVILLLSKVPIRVDECYFVLTVPANSNNNITRVFLESMKKTGTREDKVCTLSDAVAAYLTCRRDTKERQEEDIMGKIMVLDIGEESTTMTVLEKNNESEIVQIDTRMIPQTFQRDIQDTFIDFFGKPLVDSFKTDNPMYWVDLFRNVRETYLNHNFRQDRLVFRIPISFAEFCEEKHGTFIDAIKNSTFKSSIRWIPDKISLNTMGITMLFSKAWDNFEHNFRIVRQHTDLADIKTVLVVGEYAKIYCLKDKLTNIFDDSVRLIIADNPVDAVMRGGVLYGHNPIKVISSNRHLNLLSTVDKQPTGQQTSTQKCVSCKDDGAFYCYECTLIYCENCKKTHDKIPATKSHKVTDLKKAEHSISRPGVLCNTHKDVYTHACVSCNVLICSKCVTTTHKGHDFSDIGLMVQERRQHLAKDVSVLKSGLLKLESEVADIQSMDIESTAQKDIEEVETVKRQMIDVVERHVSFRSNEVDDVLQMQHEELKYGLNRKQRILDQQRTLLTSLERLIEDDHDVSFFMAYNVLRKEIIDVNDVIGNPLTSEIRPLDKRAFLETTVNSIISSFGLCAAEVTDGKVTLKTNQSDKKENK